ncbi:MAG: HNH endonuclease signature motif containing protein [Anaerolineae bacterium]|nr:HNH endonuclease signature motif containing protein [Anaerolineae bacterium]
MAPTQIALIRQYFERNPNRDIPHPEIVDWATAEYERLTGGRVFRDPDRAIRKLHQEGFLIKVSKGVYRYDPELAHQRQLEDFTPEVREQIFARDGYRCVICGLGRAEGVEIHADHIKPKDRGGQATLENGQTLCSRHNFLKKNYSQTESGKRFFIRLYRVARAIGDQHMIEFCRQILATYDRFGINGHIDWRE